MVSWFAEALNVSELTAAFSPFASLFEIRWRDARPVTD
jgi:hypothetical protein